MKDLQIVEHMKRLSFAWEDSDIDGFLKALDLIRTDRALSKRQLDAICKTLAQQQAATYWGILSQGEDLDVPEDAGWTPDAKPKGKSDG